jgi:putative phosphoribosyl transferase
MKVRLFKNRTDAGRKLASLLARREFKNPVILALPRGGVPVAAEVAHRLNAPLDLVLVRKLGCPGQPELAVGAVVDGEKPEIVTNDAIIRESGTPQDYIEQEARRQLAIIEKRRKLWLAGRPRVPVEGTTAILVDDGIATGATVRCALHALRRQQPHRLVVATPVAPSDTVRSLETEADEVITLETPEPFGAIGLFYNDFTQVSDGEVSTILDAFATRPKARS